VTATEAATVPSTALVLYRPPVPEPAETERLTCKHCGSQSFKLYQEVSLVADVEEFHRSEDGELVTVAINDTEFQSDCHDDWIECARCAARTDHSWWEWDG
jgi:hypothetical protein